MAETDVENQISREELAQLMSGEFKSVWKSSREKV